jgi:hypothetical protein
LQPLLADLFSLCTFYCEYEFSLESSPKYTPLDVMVIVAIVANHPSIGLPQKFEIEMEPTCSPRPTYLLGFLKLYLLNVSLQSPSFFLIASKVFSNLDIREDF